ncbi:MAG: hypothetical protein IPK50_07665 [Fibrobacterota bacterium]|nr:MAG: hypothetical protein IPK50_07665 [Fibrobacterota bacterium]
MSTDIAPDAQIHIIWDSPSVMKDLNIFEIVPTAAKGLKSGQRITLEFYGIEANADLGVFETFQVELAKMNNKWSFRNLRDPRPANDPARKGTHLFCDRFRLTFKGILGSVECILPADHRGYEGIVEVGIKASAESKIIPVFSMLQKISRGNPAKILVGMQTLSEQLGALMHPAPAELDHIPDHVKLHKDKTFAIQTQKIESWNQAVDTFFRNPETPYKVHIAKFRRFNVLAKQILRLKKDLWVMPYGMSKSPSENELAAAQKEQRQIQDEMAQYLDLDRGIPDSYREEAKKGMARRLETQNMDEDNLLNDPLVQLVCCLPMGGLVEGAILITNGQVAQGMRIAGLNLVTYGGFNMLRSAKRTYQLFKATTREGRTIAANLVETRLSIFFASRTEWTLAAWRAAGKVIELEVNTQLGGLVSMVPYLMDFSRFKIDDFSLLFKNRDVLVNCLKAAKDQPYKDWLKQSKNINDALLSLAVLRSIAVFRLGYPEFAKLADHNSPSSGDTLQKSILEGADILATMLNNNPEEKKWLQKDLMEALADLDAQHFTQGRLGLFQDWEEQENACIAELNRLKNLPRRHAGEKHATRAEMSKKFSDLKVMWEARSKSIHELCGADSDTPVEDCVQNAASSALVDAAFDDQMEKFLSLLLGARNAATLDDPLVIAKVKGKAVSNAPSHSWDGVGVTWTLSAPYRVVRMDWSEFEKTSGEILLNYFQD